MTSSTGPDVPNQLGRIYLSFCYCGYILALHLCLWYFGFSDDISNFCDIVEDFCGRAEMPDNLDGADGPSLSLSDTKVLTNEIMSARAKKILQLIPVDTLVRLMNVLDHHIQCGQGLSVNENEDVSLPKIFIYISRKI